MVRNRVLFVLVLAGLAAATTLAFLTIAPNRLVSGTPISLGAALHGWGLVLPVLGAALALGAFLPPGTRLQGALTAAAAGFLLVLIWSAGSAARPRPAVPPRCRRPG